ncbi:MAG: ester cyclase [Chthoniobacterales bacterium]|nr:ester cyclase [Chthoniobacterales bacterium]
MTLCQFTPLDEHLLPFPIADLPVRKLNPHALLCFAYFVLLLSFLSPCSGDTMAVTGFAQAAPAAEEAALGAAAGATPCPTTTTDENKALVQRYWKEVWHAGGTDVVGELLAPSEVHHWGFGTDTTGNAAFAERVKVFLAAFPDIQLTADRVVAEGNMLVTRWTATATHPGPFGGRSRDGSQGHLDRHQHLPDRLRQDHGIMG